MISSHLGRVTLPWVVAFIKLQTKEVILWAIVWSLLPCFTTVSWTRCTFLQIYAKSLRNSRTSPWNGPLTGEISLKQFLKVDRYPGGPNKRHGDNNDKNQVSLVAYLDFSKAFDTIDHNIFIKKIKHIGFSETPLKWFDSYLKDRSQIVIANNTKSLCKKLTTGVPQGSILGPLAFLLYINDLVDNISQCKTLLYADDTILLRSHQDVGIATTHLQNDLTKLDTWCFDNKLSINYKKTKTMIFGPRHLTKKTTKDMGTKVGGGGGGSIHFIDI